MGTDGWLSQVRCAATIMRGRALCTPNVQCLLLEVCEAASGWQRLCRCLPALSLHVGYGRSGSTEPALNRAEQQELTTRLRHHICSIAISVPTPAAGSAQHCSFGGDFMASSPTQNTMCSESSASSSLQIRRWMTDSGGNWQRTSVVVRSGHSVRAKLPGNVPFFLRDVSIQLNAMMPARTVATAVAFALVFASATAGELLLLLRWMSTLAMEATLQAFIQR